MKTQTALSVPPELAKAILSDIAAKTAFEAMPPSHRAEYIKWIAEAKKPETRHKRSLEALEKMREWGAGRRGKNSGRSPCK